MKKLTLDTTPFCDKHSHLPETDCVALWTFIVEGEMLSIWGTLAEASSTASLYAHTNAEEDTAFLLTDYRPAPRRVFSVRIR